MLRLLVALGSLLTTAGISGFIVGTEPTAPSVALHTPARYDPPPTSANATSMAMTTTVSCARLTPPPPPDFHREAVGTLDITQLTFDVAFPVERADAVDHIIVRFATEWGGPAARHSVRLEDALHRTLRDEEGTTLALTGAPVAGKYVARLTGSGILGVESVRATIDVHYAQLGFGARNGAVQWAFLADITALGTSAPTQIPLDVTGARPADLRVVLQDGLAPDIDVRVLDEFGNALREQRTNAVDRAGGFVVEWPLNPHEPARVLAIDAAPVNGPARFVVTVTALPDAPAPKSACVLAMDG